MLYFRERSENAENLFVIVFLGFIQAPNAPFGLRELGRVRLRSARRDPGLLTRSGSSVCSLFYFMFF